MSRDPGNSSSKKKKKKRARQVRKSIQSHPIPHNEKGAPAAMSPPIQPLSVRALAKGPRTEATENQGPLIELDNKI
jgi:hypothetical protein